MATSTATIHPLAPEYLPRFITPPGATDWMLVNTAIFLIVAALLLGVLYLTLHSLPDRMAHRRNAMQFQLIAVLTVLALFTHNSLFCLLALLIAVVQVPDIMTPLRSIAKSLEKATGREGVADTDPQENERADHV